MTVKPSTQNFMYSFESRM